MALASKGRLLADRYRVLGRLGAGGMAVVVLAEDERLGRKVAVKRLHSESPDEAARRFQREAKLGASLNHPNIVAVYDTLADEEGVLIVMEYVDGPTLRQEMDGGPLQPARAVEVLCGMAAGLDHAHEHGVVHRDVKPANVLIARRDGTVKLADLGIATAAERTNITGTGVALGTAAYMAPERLDGHAGGPPADVYATAAVAFEALSGQKAVTGKTAMEVARRVISQPPPDLAELVPGTPRRAADALRRGLAKDPGERQPTVGELVRELSAAYAEAAQPQSQPEPQRQPEPVADPIPLPTRRRPRRGWLVPAALAVAAVAVLLVVLLTSSGGGSGTGNPQAARSSSPKASPSPKPAPAPAPTATDPSTPTGALASFYTRAANHDINSAWALGTDRLHAQFRSLAAFTATFRTLRSISFPQLHVKSQSGNSATVSFRSVARHTGYTDRCTAQAAMVHQAPGWMVDHLDSVACSRSKAS
jgi:serine/threonine-protein kinase